MKSRIVALVWLCASSVLAQVAAPAQSTRTSSGSTASTKRAIQDAQQRLQASGYDPGVADGAMGSKTIVALKKFQSDHNLPVTGTLDQKTAALLSSSKPGPPPKPSDNSDAAAGGANMATDAVQPFAEGGLNFNSKLSLRVWADKGDGDEIIGTTPAPTALSIPKCRWWAIEPLQDVGVAALQEDIRAYGIKGLKIGTATDQDMAQLRDWAGLQVLDLSGSAIVESELANLRDLKSLRVLRLSHTGFPGPLASATNSAGQVSVVKISDVTSGNNAAIKARFQLAATRDQILSVEPNSICVVPKAGPKRCEWYFTDNMFLGASTGSGIETTTLQLDGRYRMVRSVEPGTIRIKLSPGRGNRDEAELYFLGIRSSDVAGFTFGGFPELPLASNGPFVNLMRLKGLEMLDLSLNDLADARLADLGALTGLQDLDLDDTSITDAGLSYVQQFKGLQSLRVSGRTVTDVGLAKIGTLKRLRTLSVRNTNISDAGLATLKELQGLRRLELPGTDITDAGLARLVGLKSLETLDIAVTPITDIGLKSLTDLKTLKTLNILATKITDTGLAEIGNIQGLQSLSLGGPSKLTEAGLARLLREHDTLQELNLYSTTAATDAILTQIGGMQALRKLSVTGLAKITDAGLMQLKGMTGLQSLDLSGARITAAGLAEIQKALPRLTIKR